jgi:MOSC domain-containing protein YiiM
MTTGNHSSGTVVSIARHAKQRAPIEELDCARITPEAGVEGDCHGEPGPSQVTVVSEEGWHAATADLATELSWTLRRANLLVRGIDLLHTAGKHLQVGEVLLEISAENEPCWLMDKQHRGLRKALTPAWRAGVSCRVIRGAAIKLGDRVRLLEAGAR